MNPKHDDNQRPLVLYLSGPMRGIPQFNVPAFDAEAEKLRNAGFEIISPVDKERSNYNWSSMTGNEDVSEFMDLNAALARDLTDVLLRADGVATLPGAEKSRGACAEMAAARAVGKPVLPSSYWPRMSAAAKNDIRAQHRQVTADHQAERRTDEERVVNQITGGAKGTKIERFDLIPKLPLEALARLYGQGARKYADRNWERGYEWSLSFAALNRHLWAWWGGEDNDTETGVSHLTNVAWHAFALREFMSTHPELDNRPKRAKE